MSVCECVRRLTSCHSRPHDKEHAHGDPLEGGGQQAPALQDGVHHLVLEGDEHEDEDGVEHGQPGGGEAERDLPKTHRRGGGGKHEEQRVEVHIGWKTILRMSEQ